MIALNVKGVEMNYSEERQAAISELESVINQKVNLIKSLMCEIKRLKQDINKIDQSLDADYEKLMELDPCLMR